MKTLQTFLAYDCHCMSHSIRIFTDDHVEDICKRVNNLWKNGRLRRQKIAMTIHKQDASHSYTVNQSMEINTNCVKGSYPLGEQVRHGSLLDK